jgi:hypothetical protein
MGLKPRPMTAPADSVASVQASAPVQTQAPAPEAKSDADEVKTNAMARSRLRAHSDHQIAVLECVRDLGDHAYGLLVWELMCKRTGQPDLPVAQVYTTLNRQTKRGYLTKTDMPSPVNKNRRVKMFALTDEGRETLSEP